MTTPGFQNQQALHRAMQAGQDSANMARRRGRRGALGAVGRLIGTIVSLAILGFAIGVFVIIMNKADPGWFNHAVNWISSLF
jgi:hypothetical protein